jgi:hypothetical protein
MEFGFNQNKLIKWEDLKLICNTWPSIHVYMHGQDFVCWHSCELEMQNTFFFTWSMYHNINISVGENINAMGIGNLCKQSMWGKQYWDYPSCKNKLDKHQGKVHDMNLLMIGRSSLSLTSSRSLKPSMVGWLDQICLCFPLVTVVHWLSSHML